MPTPPTSITFPNVTTPSYYANCVFSASPAVRNGIVYSDGSNGAPSVVLAQSGANAYTVYNYWGQLVSSGSMSGTTVVPTAPGGGWVPGWYRIYFTGSSSDAVFGPAYGSTNFCVVRNNPNFVTMSTNANYFPATPSLSYAAMDTAMRGPMGCGPSRFMIDDVTNPTVNDGDGVTLAHMESLAGTYETYAPLTADSARPRYMWCEFANGTVNTLALPAATGGATYLTTYPVSGTVAANGNNLYVSIGAGSSSGAKIQVFYPNSSTLVETYDNQASPTAAITAINGVSAYIWVAIPASSPGTNPGTLAATAIGNALYNGTVSCVSALYSSGVQYFEGPRNEPTLTAGLAQEMKIFQAAVKAGNSSAKAMGPVPVEISGNLTGSNSWTTFLAAGGGSYCDAISFHSYNAINGDLNLGRTSLAAFKALLATYGLSSLPLWQTEATACFNCNYGVYQPHMSRWVMLQTLLWEQYGVPREQNPSWYDMSHGFWSFPTWLENSDNSLNPTAVMMRVLAEETFGQAHSQILDFGTPGNGLWLGSVYATPGGGTSTVVLFPASPMPGATVTLSVTGTTGSLTCVDSMGVTSTVAISNGQATVPAPYLTYVQLPTGASVTVHTWNGRQAGATNIASTATAKIGGVNAPVLNDGLFLTSYGGTPGTDPGIAFSTGSLPGDTAELVWGSPVTIGRALIWAGTAPNGTVCTLEDFDVQTSVDGGTTWVTQETVTQTDNFSTWFGSNQFDFGCTFETFWQAQWVFDVPFAAPVTCNALRLYVRTTSHGGRPDAQTNPSNNSPQLLTLQEIQAYNDLSVAVLMAPLGRTAVVT